MPSGDQAGIKSRSGESVEPERRFSTNEFYIDIYIVPFRAAPGQRLPVFPSGRQNGLAFVARIRREGSGGVGRWRGRCGKVVNPEEQAGKGKGEACTQHEVARFGQWAFRLLSGAQPMPRKETP